MPSIPRRLPARRALPVARPLAQPLPLLPAADLLNVPEDAGASNRQPLAVLDRAEPPAPPPGVAAGPEPALPGWPEWAAFSSALPARALRPWTSWCLRSGHNAVLGSALLPLAGTQLEAMGELMQLQHASQQQLLRLQEQWLQRWAALWQDHREMRQSNTLSKWMAEQFNVVAQALDLIGLQASELANLEENVSVNFGYWAQQRLGAAATDT